MDPGRWACVEALFEAALAFDSPDMRAAFLAHECGEDATLHAEVVAMLASTPLAAHALHGMVAGEANALAIRTLAEQVGRRIGPYRLVSLLGEGGMGAVYLAERDDSEFATKVAIKIVARSLGSPQSIARFRDERQILAALVHPNIVRLLDGGSTDDELPYLVMEHVEGETIVRHAETRQLSVRARIGLAVPVCSALQYAHSNLVVHRDIKPSNILVDAGGVPKVLDFGIAKLLAPAPTFVREAATRTGLAPFTPEYASPEQARGEAVATTTDVYSMGAVLFELMTGRPPLPASTNPLESLRTICEVEPPRASTVASAARKKELAGDIDTIIAKALNKDPARRYASMEQLRDDLRRYLDGLPIHARTSTAGYRAWKFVRRNRGAVGAAIIITSTLIGATIVSLRQADRADAEAVRADASAVRAADEARRANEAAQRAQEETERARKAEAQIQTQLDQLRAEQRARAIAEDDARHKGSEAQLSRDQLAVALAKTQEEKRVVEAESAKAREAEARAEAARVQAEILLQREIAHAKQLEETGKKRAGDLP